jgi:hypothetical protein
MLETRYYFAGSHNNIMELQSGSRAVLEATKTFVKNVTTKFPLAQIWDNKYL